MHEASTKASVASGESTPTWRMRLGKRDSVGQSLKSWPNVLQKITVERGTTRASPIMARICVCTTLVLCKLKSGHAIGLKQAWRPCLWGCKCCCMEVPAVAVTPAESPSAVPPATAHPTAPAKEGQDRGSGKGYTSHPERACSSIAMAE